MKKIYWFSLCLFLANPSFAILNANLEEEGDKPKSKYYEVISEEGIPVYSSPLSEEAYLCDWLKGGDIIEAQKDHEGFLKVSDKSQELCGGATAVYIQEGFLSESRYAGPVSRSRISRWKAEVPHFSTPCKERGRDKIIVSFVGDVLLHGGLQVQGQQTGFRSLWEKVEPIFKNADLAYANLEGPVAEDVTCRGRIRRNDTVGGRCKNNGNYVYTSYPLFNYHPSLIPALKRSGIDVVSTANNHSLDRRSLGVDKTIDVLEANNMSYAGTRRSDAREKYYTITRAKGITLAWVACTFSTNGMPDNNEQVLDCYKSGRSNSEVLSLVASLHSQVDGVVVTPHWGPTEYVHTVHPAQMSLSKDLIEAGATAVIGAHPHVLQPWEVYKATDGREGFIHYSLGNFVSGQTSTAKRASMVLLVGFQKVGGKVVVDGVRYVPAYMAIYSNTDRRYTPLDRDTRRSSEGQAALDNVLSIFPESLRLDSTQRLTTCH